jgi:hypothetical protein
LNFFLLEKLNQKTGQFLFCRKFPSESSYLNNQNSYYRLFIGEIFVRLLAAWGIIENWRHKYLQRRPHSFPGYKPQVPESLKHKKYYDSYGEWLGAGHPALRLKIWIGI